MNSPATIPKTPRNPSSQTLRRLLYSKPCAPTTQPYTLNRKLYFEELQEKVLQAEAEHRRRIADWEKRSVFHGIMDDQRVKFF